MSDLKSYFSRKFIILMELHIEILFRWFFKKNMRPKLLSDAILNHYSFKKPTRYLPRIIANFIVPTNNFSFRFLQICEIFDILYTCHTNTMRYLIPIQYTSRFTWTRIVQNHIIYIDCLFQMDAYCTYARVFRFSKLRYLHWLFHTDVYTTLFWILRRNNWSKLNFVPERVTVKTIMTNNNNRFKHINLPDV